MNELLKAIIGLWDTFDLLLSCGLPILLAFLGWLVGRTVERNHFSRLEQMEERLLTIPLTDLRTLPPRLNDSASGGILVSGSVVLATDYFRTLLATIRKLIGGEIEIYQRLLLRARREAVCRMMYQAHQHGAVAVMNVRLETSNIQGMSNSPAPMCEVVAYGTAVLGSRGDLPSGDGRQGATMQPGHPLQGSDS